MTNTQYAIARKLAQLLEAEKQRQLADEEIRMADNLSEIVKRYAKQEASSRKA